MRSLIKNKKGALEAIGGLQTLAVMGLVIGIILGLTFYVLDQFRTEVEASEGTNSSTTYQGITKTMEAINKIPTFLGIIFLVGIIGIILLIVFAVIPAVRQPGQPGF